MRKPIIRILSVVCLVFALAGCDAKKKYVVPLELEKVSVSLSYDEPVVTIPISSGNGGYYIAYPEQVEVGLLTEDGSTYPKEDGTTYTVTNVDYKDDMFRIIIDDQDNINIEFNTSYSLMYETMSCNFIVKDRKGESQYIIVDYARHWLCCLS